MGLLLPLVVWHLLFSSCHGNQEPANQMILLNDLPGELDTHRPLHVVIRNDFKGSIEFIESEAFQIQVNVTSPSYEDLARLHYNYTNFEGSLLLQVFDTAPIVVASPLKYLLLLIGGTTLLAFLLMLIFACWWNVYRRPFIKDTKLTADSSQAPLLDAKQGDGKNQNGVKKKKKKKRTTRQMANEEYVSSEEDTLDRRGKVTSPQRQVTYGGTLSPKKDQPMEADIVATVKHGSPSPMGSSEGLLTDSTGTIRTTHLEGPDNKPVVSYIKIQPEAHKRKSGHYVPLTQCEGSGSDIERQSAYTGLTRDNSVDSQGMPDVVRSRNRTPERPEGVVTRNQGRYIPLNNSEVDSSDNEPASNMTRLSGAHIAHILSDHGNRGSPKYSHNTDRPPTTFGTTPRAASDRDRDLDGVELDSVGSSRSGGSSRSSGVKTQTGSYTDSMRSEGGRNVSDSDSAKSSSSASTFPRGGKESTYSSKFFMQQIGGRQNGHSSPGTDPSSDGSSPRLVDEAYGTMGSNGSGTMRSTGGASTGSGSSSSVVTVIASDDNTFKRRRAGRPDGVGEGPYGTAERRGGGGGGGGAYAAGGKYVQMSIMCTFCIVAMVTGVYSQILTKTEVHIKIFAPPGFLRNGSEVYFNEAKDSKLHVQTTKSPLKVIRYDVKEARISDIANNRCHMTSCTQGCDPNTGRCVCHEGFQLRDDYTCIDLNECTLDPPICQPNSMCYNDEGTYNCYCATGYFKNFKGLCESCDAPCPNGTFEVMGCNEKHQKLCKECSDKCMDEYYISAPCSATKNLQCTPCRPRCGQNQYEFTPCHGHQNRQCKDILDLRKPRVSGNIIYEDRQQSQQVNSYILKQTAGVGPLTHMLNLKRGRDFSVRVTLRESNLGVLFEAVDHSDSNDNEGFYGDQAIKARYCPYPVPEKYQLSLILHQGVTTRAKYVRCNVKDQYSSEKCEAETGYYLNPDDACETYSKFGRLPPLKPEGWSVVCTKPGILSDKFGVSSELNDLSTMMVDKSVRCAEKRTNCDVCLTMCARTMEKRQGSHRCNVTGEDADNGESPRLSHCFSCCSKDECSDICQVYHNPDCEPIRCVTGNLAEFVLSPVFSESQASAFGCHVHPKPNYKIYDIQYSVLHKGKLVNQRSLKAEKVFKGHHPEKAKDVHNFLTIYYGSEVNNNIDFIEGDSNRGQFSAGHYSSVGTRLSDIEATTRTLSVRPVRPFKVSTMKWKSENCDTESLSNLLLATSNSPMSEPYKPDSNLLVEYVDHGIYRVLNKTEKPFIYFEVPGNISVLRPLYDPTTVKDDATLKAEILRERKVWILRIQGELKSCPGFLAVKVTDPNYPYQPLYEYDMGISCPVKFSIDFNIPTDGADDYSKKYRVELEDHFRKINMMVYRPAPAMTEETMATEKSFESKGEKEMTVFTPIVAVLCVVISFLGLLLLIGFITETGKAPKKVDNKVHSQHLLFVVCYVTFRAAYSIAVTFTVLLLLIRYTNKESLSTMMEFYRFVDTADNLQKLEVEKIQGYVLEELNRQNQLANQTKVTCEKKLLTLQDVLEKTKQELRIDDTEVRLVSQVALQYIRLLVQNLTSDMKKFRDEFTSYAKKAVDRLTRSIVQTSSALQSNKWLAGAKIIYDEVQKKRSSRGQSTKQFMDWAGIRQEVERLSVDLSLENFPMPNLTDFLALEVPQTNHRQSSMPSVDEINLPRNQWYFQYENKPSSGESMDAGHVKKRKIDTSGLIGWGTLLSILVLVDLIWFVHRMARTYSTAKMILYGCPHYIDCKRTHEGRSPQRGGQRISPHQKQGVLAYLKDLHLRVMKTEFVPKLVATAATCCALYLVLRVSGHLVSNSTLASVGYFDTLVAPVHTSYNLAKTRIKTNAYRINKFEYPFYEKLVNIRTKRYQLMLEMYRDLQRSNNILHDSEFCAWKKMLQPEEQCNCTTAKTVKLTFEGCDLPPVTPMAYEKKDFGTHKRELSVAMTPYINSARQIVMDTCHMVLIFVSVLVLVDVLGAVTWIYLKRFNMLRLKPLFEIEQYPETAQS